MALTVYISLFSISFGAATLLPLQSEAALAGLMLNGYSPWLLVPVASVGNILGSIVNWWLGVKAEAFRDRKWFPLKGKALSRAQGWYHRYGRWSLLLSWLPFIGDPLTVAAGVMREKLMTFIAIVAVAKTGRYMALAWIMHGGNHGLFSWSGLGIG